jgi:hypothetical protein
MPTLTGRHQAAILDIAIDHGAAEGAGPEMLDLELGGLLRHSPAWNLASISAWWAMKRLVPAFTRARTGMTGKRSSICRVGKRVARAAAE